MKKLQLHNREEKVRLELLVKNQDIDPSYREEKFQKMSESPYPFFRGSNHLYWEDFYNDWRISIFGGRTATMTWINGDAHVYNYGAYANHHGEAIFCMDDFDDSIVADYQFDLWRMAISIVLDCNEQRLFGNKQKRKALKRFAAAYRLEMSRHEKDDPKNELHLTRKTAKGLLKKFLKKVEKKKNRLKMLQKWTIMIDGQRKFDPECEKLEILDEATYQAIEKVITTYQEKLTSEWAIDPAHFQVKDIARRVKAGTGSLGSDRYYILMEGDTDSNDDDVILDMKEQGRPPLYFHMNEKEQKEYESVFPNEGERHARAYQALAEHPDRYLGWVRYNEKDFSIKERSPFKADFPTEKLKEDSELYFMAETWGNLLASRHKRASYKLNEAAHEMPEAFKALVTGREEQFDELVVSIALQYADCTTRDYRYLLAMLD